MVVSQFESCLEGYQNAMVDFLAYEALDNGILCSKDCCHRLVLVRHLFKGMQNSLTKKLRMWINRPVR